MSAASARAGLGLLLMLTACAPEAPDSSPTPEEAWVWELPAGFPEPPVPEDNPMSAAKVALGRRLFYDPRLSGNETTSCGSCHLQALAFTDGRAHAEGATGQLHRRSAMSLTNVAYNTVYTWANPLMVTLEDQALVPMFGEEPVELGLSGMEDALLARLAADADYPQLFERAFPDEAEPVSIRGIVQAISAFERTLISGDAPIDRYLRQGDSAALSESARRGLEMFFSEDQECYHCHGSFNFMDSVGTATSAFREVYYHNTGLYNLDGEGAFPASDQGLIEVSGLAADMGRFRAPTLRNVALTAPYMHDGSVATLDEALDHYAHGGRLIAEGEDAGDGSLSPLKSQLVPGFTLTEEQRADLLAFLMALTDEGFVTDPRFSDPFEEE